jgi:hypothetical protein
MKRGELYRVGKGYGTDPKRSRVLTLVRRQVLIESDFSTLICAPIYSACNGLANQVPGGGLLKTCRMPGVMLYSELPAGDAVPRPKTARGRSGGAARRRSSDVRMCCYAQLRECLHEILQTLFPYGFSYSGRLDRMISTSSSRSILRFSEDTSRGDFL